MKLVTGASSLNAFMKKTGLKKKELAEMTGITLSYAYMLCEDFTTRASTIERLAVIMGTCPEQFPEYEGEPQEFPEAVYWVQKKVRQSELSSLEFIKKFPQKRRLEVVDFLRGSAPLPLNYSFFDTVTTALDVLPEELFVFVAKEIKNLLANRGVEEGALSSAIESIKKYYL